eukprot:4976380-Pyramimonas_sp.AAC.1
MARCGSSLLPPSSLIHPPSLVLPPRKLQNCKTRSELTACSQAEIPNRNNGTVPRCMPLKALVFL